jgi:predicted NBD/HSP70 family sugar kinase
MRYLQDDMMRGEKPTAQHAIKEENLKRIFLEVYAKGETTRIQLAHSTGLSAATVSALVDELVRAGVIMETGLVHTEQIGRKPINLRIRPEGRQLPVISLNRSGIQYTLYDLKIQALESMFIAHTADQYGGFSEANFECYPDAGSDYANLIRIALQRSRLYDPALAIALCVVAPGFYNLETDAFQLSDLHVSFSRSVFDKLEHDIRMPIFLGSSPMAFAYSEKIIMEAQGEKIRDLVYLHVRDGIGAGILYKGDLLFGAQDVAGDISHMIIGSDGTLCVHGNRGCLERYVSLNSIVKSVKHLNLAAAGESVSLESIGTAYDTGKDGAIRQLVDDIAERLFRAISSIVCLTGIKRIAIGGGIEQLGDGFLTTLRTFQESHCAGAPTRGLTIDYARSGPDGDTMGIASYFLDKIFTFA